MNFYKILLFLTFVNFANACDCNPTVETYYNKITNEIPKHFEPILNEIENISSELDVSIQNLEKEKLLLDKTIENKITTYVEDSRDIEQLNQILNYVSLKNDIQIHTNKVNVQNNILTLSRETLMSNEDNSNFIEETIIKNK